MSFPQSRKIELTAMASRWQRLASLITFQPSITEYLRSAALNGNRNNCS